jgi:hypothetical protein
MKKLRHCYSIVFILLSAAAFAAGNTSISSGVTATGTLPASTYRSPQYTVPKDMTLGEMRVRAHARMDTLDHTSAANWEHIRQKAAQHGGKAATMTLAQARQEAHNFAATLDKMTPQQWDTFKHRMGANEKPDGQQGVFARQAAPSLPANGN